MNIQGLIERYEKFKAGKKKMTSVDLVLKDLRSLDEPEPLPFKLKDVVGRIRGFDPTTQARWFNDILKELGDDYGLMKYRSGYEQGKLDGAWVGNQLKDADKIRKELNKVKVLQFVADWYEEHKKEFYSNLHKLAWELIENSNEDCFVPEKELDSDFKRWYYKNETAIQTLINMHQFGYEVEKEKRYSVRVKGICGNHEFLNCEKHSKKWLFSDRKENTLYATKFTRKELEDAGFSEVFNSPLFEVVEVE